MIGAARIVAREDGRRTMGRFGEWLCDNLPVVSMILVALLLGALVGLA